MPIKKKLQHFAKNVAWNSAAAAIATVAVQVVIYPMIARLQDAAEFGMLLASMAIANLCGLVAGGATANLVIRRAGQRYDGVEAGPREAAAVNTMFAFVVALVLAGGVAAHLALSLAVSVPFLMIVTALSAKNYLMAEHKLALHYQRVAAANALTGIAAIAALIAYFNQATWSPLWIFAIGELAGFASVAYGSAYIKAGMGRLSDAFSLYRTYVGLAVSALSNNLITYGDRLLLPRLAGLDVVPTFFAALMGGRMAQLGVSVVSGVVTAQMASVARSEISVRIKMFFVVICVFGVLVTVVLNLVMPYVLAILYPQFKIAAEAILPICNAAFGVKCVELLVKPVMIRVGRIRSIALIDGLSAIAYVSGGLIATNLYGIGGLAWTLLIVSIIRVLWQGWSVRHALLNSSLPL